MREPDDFKAAIDSMFRIRAVESPPDTAGTRTIWHRGNRGAELVTRVDAQGRVIQQEFTLFDRLVRWQRDAGFQASSVHLSEGAAQTSHEGIADAAQALARYSGTDRFLLHLKERLAGAVSGGDALGDDVPITGSSPAMLEELGRVAPSKMPRVAIALAVGALVLAAVALVLMLME